jgi:hypothetical protein
MADYGGRGGGQSLRDALNQMYPMTGLGNYSTMFPPNTGADIPSSPVPIPTQRPPTMAPPVPPNNNTNTMTQPLGAGVNPPGGPPPAGGPVPLPRGPLPMPMTFPAAQGMAQQYAGRPTLPPDLAARLMQLGGLGGY